MNSKVLKNTSIYTLISFLQKSLSFIFLPLYTSKLSTGDYGIISIITSIFSLFLIIFSLSINNSIIRFYFDFKNKKDELKKFWGASITFVFIFSLLFLLSLILFHSLFSKIIPNIYFFPYIILGLLNCFFYIFFDISQTIYQIQEDAFHFSLFNISYFILNITLTLFFLLFLHLKAIGVLYANFLTTLIIVIICFFRIKKLIIINLELSYIKTSLSYCLPLIPHSLSAWFISLFNRIIINRFLSISLVGIYNIGFQFSYVINLITTSLNQAYVPWLYNTLHKNDTQSDRKIADFSFIIIVIYNYFALCISLFSLELLQIFVNKTYFIAWEVINILCFSYVFNGIYYFFISPVFFSKKGAKKISYITVSNAIINLFLNYLLIPKFGLIGSAYSVFISMFLYSVITYLYMIRVNKIPFNFFNIYYTTILFFLLSNYNHIVKHFSLEHSLLIKSIVFFSISLSILLIYKSYIKILLKELKR